MEQKIEGDVSCKLRSRAAAHTEVRDQAGVPGEAAVERA